ncbi:hypothetical protein [Paraburkholderia caballeronis]|uniref:hypothetical protein n=1 Tax=Paraburkholderia caballeronis TaxID=416943 RepID=UPI001065F93A|nr:hypothetical protein [Paraburkholderia caballeronis]
MISAATVYRAAGFSIRAAPDLFLKNRLRIRSAVRQSSIFFACRLIVSERFSPKPFLFPPPPAGFLFLPALPAQTFSLHDRVGLAPGRGGKFAPGRRADERRTAPPVRPRPERARRRRRGVAKTLASMATRRKIVALVEHECNLTHHTVTRQFM